MNMDEIDEKMQMQMQMGLMERAMGDVQGQKATGNLKLNSSHHCFPGGFISTDVLVTSCNPLTTS